MKMPWLIPGIFLIALETTPKKGFVKKFTRNTTTATVTAKGRRMTRPVMKYFFMLNSFYRQVTQNI